MRRAEDQKPEIVLNVYQANQGDASTTVVGLPGCCGAYHSGVEIAGTEYSFASGVGIYECRPGEYGHVVERIGVGASHLSHKEIRAAMDRLRAYFTGDSYHVVLHNCNSFSEALVRECTNNSKGLPAWVNRAAWWASWFKCCFPRIESDRLIRPPSTSGAPRQVGPMFSGDGAVLNKQSGIKPLTTEEQRKVRLRALGVSN